MPDLADLPLLPIMLGLFGLLVVAGVIAWFVGSLTGGKPSSLDKQRRGSKNWAEVRDVKPLRANTPDARRLRLCRLGAAQLYTPPLRSKLVIAPSGAGKTPRVVVPDVLLYQGPAVVTSVKGDVLALTQAARRRQGPVWIFDPAESVGPTSRWSPLATIDDWADALDAARWIQNSSKVEGSGGVADRDFWDAQARFLLAPLMYVAAKENRSMADVARLVTGGDDVEQLVTRSLQRIITDDQGPMIYWSRFVGLEQRTKSSVLVTAATVLEAWTHPRVAKAVNLTGGENTEEVLDLDFVTSGTGTLYLVAPAAEQAAFSSIFETLVNAVAMRVERAAQARGGLALDPPLLLALDEAANIAPMRNLDQLASKGAGEGIIVVSVWQDEGQIETIYGPSRARTIMANHYAKVYLPGIQDHRTLVHLSEQIGQDTMTRTSTTVGASTSTTTSENEFVVAPPAWLRQLEPTEVIVLCGRYKPILGALPAWYEDRELRALIPADVAATYDNFHAAKKKPKRPPLAARLSKATAALQVQPENAIR